MVSTAACATGTLGMKRPPAVVVPSAAAATPAWWIAVRRSTCWLLLLLALNDTAIGAEDPSNAATRTVDVRIKVILWRCLFFNEGSRSIDPKRRTSQGYSGRNSVNQKHRNTVVLLETKRARMRHTSKKISDVIFETGSTKFVTRLVGIRFVGFG